MLMYNFVVFPAYTQLNIITGVNRSMFSMLFSADVAQEFIAELVLLK